MADHNMPALTPRAFSVLSAELGEIPWTRRGAQSRHPSPWHADCRIDRVHLDTQECLLRVAVSASVLGSLRSHTTIPLRLCESHGRPDRELVAGGLIPPLRTTSFAMCLGAGSQTSRGLMRQWMS